MSGIVVSQQLTGITCWVCGMNFAMPAVIERKRAEDGKDFWCPGGDRIAYGPSLLDKERKRREAAEARAVHAEDQRVAAERSAAAARGHVTRLKNRAAAGMCPCCKRHFVNLERHMGTKHPDFAKDET